MLKTNMAGKASFIPPVIEDNPDGWGPCSIPTAFKDIPYQPFSKGDRLGKVKPQLARFFESVGKIRKTRKLCHVGFRICRILTYFPCWIKLFNSLGF